jgi:excisionase family DNA binding protein
MNVRPFSPETLGERWACSAQTVRLMVRRGELAAFKLGKLYRIPASEVERVECQNIESSNTEANLASPGRAPSVDGLELRLARMSGAQQKLSLVGSGGSGPSQPRNA